jgi:disulfide bond formation protein DsbB
MTTHARRPLRFHIVSILAACVVVATACGTSTPNPTTPLSEDATTPGDPLAGAQMYIGSCSSCHGADLAGVDGLGNALLPSDFVMTQSEADLATLVAVGRPASDPSNSSALDMPPRGGNPNLSDQDLRDIAAYLKGLQ